MTRIPAKINHGGSVGGIPGPLGVFSSLGMYLVAVVVYSGVLVKQSSVNRIRQQCRLTSYEEDVNLFNLR